MINIVSTNPDIFQMNDRILKESDVLKIAFQLPLVVNSAFVDAVKALPSADRPQGEWTEDPINKNIRQCSNCKASYTKDFLKSMTLYAEPKEVPNYCPNCGAKMKGVDDDII